MWSADKKSWRGEDNKQFKTEKEKRASEKSSVTTSGAARGRRAGAVDNGSSKKTITHASAHQHPVCRAELLTTLL